MTDWLKTIAAIAPTLATAMGGPLAGLAVGVATKALGLDDGGQDALEAAVMSGNPDVLLRIKQADQEFQVHLKELGVDLEKIAADDRASARGREASTGDSATPRALAAVMVLGLLGALFFVMRGSMAGMDPIAQNLVSVIIGYLASDVNQIVSYYFGSSADHSKMLSTKT